MIDWTQPMAQTFEFCEVDPDTWQDARRLLEVKGGELSFDEGEDTGGHATFRTSEPLGGAPSCAPTSWQSRRVDRACAYP